MGGFFLPHPTKPSFYPIFVYRLKKILAILLLVCVSYQYVAKIGVIAWYQANKDYVAQELCENKDKSDLGCEGKCYLKKQLDKVENNAPIDKELPAKKHKNELPEYLSTITSFKFNHSTFSAQTNFSLYKNLYSYTVITSVFHPPNFC